MPTRVVVSNNQDLCEGADGCGTCPAVCAHPGCRRGVQRFSRAIAEEGEVRRTRRWESVDTLPGVKYVVALTAVFGALLEERGGDSGKGWEQRSRGATGRDLTYNFECRISNFKFRMGPNPQSEMRHRMEPRMGDGEETGKRGGGDAGIEDLRLQIEASGKSAIRNPPSEMRVGEQGSCEDQNGRKDHDSTKSGRAFVGRLPDGIDARWSGLGLGAPHHDGAPRGIVVSSGRGHR
jgi:hypothetical protein